MGVGVIKHHALVLLFFIVCNSMVWKGRHGQLHTKLPNPSGNRKLGPPSRRSIQPQRPTAEEQTEQITTGRVSVHCVGSSINLAELRAHVFRRGFGTVSSDLVMDDIIDRMSLKLDRSDSEEYLHISNEPMFVTTNAQGAAGIPDTNVKVLLFTSLHFTLLLHLTSLATQPYAMAINYWSQEQQLENGDNDSGNGNGNGQSQQEISRHMDAMLMATQDVFYFDYGCVVFWGLSQQEELAALDELAPFVEEPNNTEERESSTDSMDFQIDRKSNPQRPIKFDRIKMKTLKMEEKLALSYAMAQSSKLFVFESRVLRSLESTRYLPRELALKGKITASKKELNTLIGTLFVEQTEVNLFSSILDTPSFLWDDEEYKAPYEYTRKYLEVDERVSLLNSRVSVIRELLDVLTAQVAENNSGRLEWIVIWLIAIEILLGIASNPLFAGRRVMSAVLLPTIIVVFKQTDDPRKILSKLFRDRDRDRDRKSDER